MSIRWIPQVLWLGYGENFWDIVMRSKVYSNCRYIERNPNIAILQISLNIKTFQEPLKAWICWRYMCLGAKHNNRSCGRFELSRPKSLTIIDIKRWNLSTRSVSSPLKLEQQLLQGKLSVQDPIFPFPI